MGLFVLVAGTATLVFRGPAAGLDALAGAGRLLLSVLPMMAAGVLIAGFAQMLVPRDAVARTLGRESGLRGLLLATLAGTLMPGGPMASFPLVLVLIGAGADRGSVVAFITGWATLGLQRVVTWEIAVLGPKFALIRFLASLALPLIAGAIARRLPIRVATPTGERL
ncbi:MAG: permease [Proteobacteria bacterium]|nr:permease [Pseudomonadota bacterium]